MITRLLNWLTMPIVALALIAAASSAAAGDGSRALAHLSTLLIFVYR